MRTLIGLLDNVFGLNVYKVAASSSGQFSFEALFIRSIPHWVNLTRSIPLWLDLNQSSPHWRRPHPKQFSFRIGQILFRIASMYTVVAP